MDKVLIFKYNFQITYNTYFFTASFHFPQINNYNSHHFKKEYAVGWTYIVIASICEVCWAVGLKYSVSFTNLKASIFTVITMILSYIFLSLGVKHIPLGTAYAVWTGSGAAITALYGILFFDESKEILRIVFILLIICGVIGLRLTSK